MSEGSLHSLSWEAGEVPMSERFGDTFYSRHDGRAEAAHVFLGGNGLPEGFAGRDRFVIAELGFGTGLNFLETWRQWIEVRRLGQQLSFVSFEMFPMGADDMARALARWAELSELSGALVARWTAAGQGSEETRHWQIDTQTQLRVIVGDAGEEVSQWSGSADAWFLDGFSPAKNPGMWTAELMAEVFARTVPGGSFATYTAAGWVRRNLSAAGFDVEKRPGYAGKREMMSGVKPAGLKSGA